MESRKCKWCKKGLKPFKITVDWDTRKYHKQCFLLYHTYLEVMNG